MEIIIRWIHFYPNNLLTFQLPGCYGYFSDDSSHVVICGSKYHIG